MNPRDSDDNNVEVIPSAALEEAVSELRRLRKAGPPQSTKDESFTFTGTITQWSTPDKVRFFPAGEVVKKLPPALYSVEFNPSVGPFLQSIPIRTEGLLRLPHTSSEKVLAQVETFWGMQPRFDDFGLIHKRGILLWGPPGSGKSCTIQLVMKDIITRGGIGLNFGHPSLFVQGLRMIRQIHQDMPIVVLMEDLDSQIKNYDESTILNILDGAEAVEHIVFLASTNYPELLGPRIINRPSRFDRRFKIGHPDLESRRIYLAHLVGSRNLPEVDVERWANDTKEFSLAHLKELFVAVVILGDTYDEALVLLRSMREQISSEDGKKLGFSGVGLGSKQAGQV